MKEEHTMLVTTTPIIEGHPIQEYLGIVSGETILGMNVLQESRAWFRGFFGGRTVAREDELRKAQESALQEMTSFAQQFGATAIVGVAIDYETIGSSNTLMVVAAGTAVRT